MCIYFLYLLSRQYQKYENCLIFITVQSIGHFQIRATEIVISWGGLLVSVTFIKLTGNSFQEVMNQKIILFFFFSSSLKSHLDNHLGWASRHLVIISL